MTAEEVWEQAASAACCAIKWKPSANRRGAAVIRTAMEAYAAEKVTEALAAEPTKAMVEAGRECALEHTDDEIDVADIYRAMQAANQHHGGNDADIPQEVREAAMTDHERFITAVAYDCGYQAGLAAGKRAGMERAAEIADEWCADCSSIETNWDDGYYQASAGLAQAIRSENDVKKL